MENELIGHCYCGEFIFSIPSTITPLRSLYCHCDSCRRSHSSSLYYVIYINKNNFKIISGENNIQEFKKPSSNVIRAFCKVCGTRIYNKLTNRDEWLGLFPNLLNEDVQRNLPEQFKPTCHLHCNESFIELDKFNDELLRIAEE